MAIQLDTLEQRVIGVLIEKELTTPEQYPLTMGALLAGCNQKSNREPTMSVEDYELEGAVRSLMDKGWVIRKEPIGGRTMRYAHDVRVQLGVDAADLALLSELLCRGPQAPGALKTRCSRMHPFPNMDDVEDRLAALSVRPVPYVVELERQPRERQARWQHMLGKEQTSLGTAPVLERVVDPLPPRPAAMPTPAALPTSAALPTRAGPDLEARVESLEQQLEALTDRLDRLEGR